MTRACDSTLSGSTIFVEPKELGGGVEVFPDYFADGTRVFLARSCDHHGIMGQGNTPAEAIADYRDAWALCCEMMGEAAWR